VYFTVYFWQDGKQKVQCTKRRENIYNFFISDQICIRVIQ